MAKIVKLKTKQHFSSYKSLGVKLTQDMMVGKIADLNDLAADLEKPRKIKKGTKVSVSVEKLMFRGFLLRIQGKGINGYAFVDDRCSVETAFLKRFEPVMKTVHVCSIIKPDLREELLKLQIKIYKENSKGRAEWAKVIEPLNQKLAA